MGRGAVGKSSAKVIAPVTGGGDVSTTVFPMTYVSLPKMYFTSSRAALVSLWPLSR